MRNVIKFVLLVTLATTAHADDVNKAWPQDVGASQKFKAALKKNDRAAVAAMISYPLERERPLPSIENEKEFIASWDDYFDEKTVAQIVKADPGDFGWRGMALGNGDIWFNDEKISGINIHTNHYQKSLKAVIAEDNAKLHPSAKDYSRIQFACDTDNLHVRVQEHGTDDLRLIVWKQGDALLDKPKLAIKQGTSERQGSGGSTVDTFKDGASRYEIIHGGICGEDCNDYFVTYYNDKQVARNACAVKAK